MKYNDLNYLKLKPKRIYWKVIAGPDDLSEIQQSDLVYDAYDYKIRQLEFTPSIAI